MKSAAKSGQPVLHPDSDQQGKSLAGPAFATISSPYYAMLVALFVGVMLISDITTTKGVTLAPSIHFTLGPIAVHGIATDGAFYLFPLAYILGDVISEVYGFKAMRRVVAAGFVILCLASLCFWITLGLPQAPGYTGQSSFRDVAGVVPQILLAGLSGYVVGELINSLVMVKLKARAGERKLWVRLLTSTVVSELVDTTIFCLIAATAIGFHTWQDILNYTLIGFVWKCLVEIAVMPITYRVCIWLKKNEPTYQEALAEREARGPATAAA